MMLEKQIAINRLRLPMDIVNIIKDYTFDSLMTGFIKKKKKEIIDLFDQAIYSRKNTAVWVSETSEEWIFLFGIGEKQIESCNCSICGNYIVALDYRIVCHCPHQNHDIEIDGPIIFEEEEDDDEPILPM